VSQDGHIHNTIHRNDQDPPHLVLRKCPLCEGEELTPHWLDTDADARCVVHRPPSQERSSWLSAEVDPLTRWHETKRWLMKWALTLNHKLKREDA
jgi:hypothetical protein